MAQSFSSQREQVTTATADLDAIQPGWTVYDALERPLGNVTDLEGGRLRVDGRPEGRGQFEVSSEAVHHTEDGKVYLKLEMQELHMEAEPVPSGAVGPTTGGPASMPASEEAEGGSSWSSTMKIEDRPQGLHGSYSATGAPRTEEASSFRDWNSDLAGSPWPRYALWLGSAAIGTASAVTYAWWRNRQARRGRFQSIARALSKAGDSMTPVVEVARDRRQAWWVAPLAALSLAAFYLRSTRDESQVDAATSRMPRARLKGRLPSLDLPTAELPRVPLESPPLWTAIIPIGAAALGAAWLAARQRRPLPMPIKRHDGRRLRDIMTGDVQVIRPDASIFEAASLMKRLDVGFLPVCDGKRLQGVLTDRDIVVRPVADSHDPQLTAVSNALTAKVIYAYDDEPVERAAGIMRRHRIRRLPIVDRQKNLVGVVSLGDLAVDTGDERLSGATLEQVSEPSRPRR